MGGGGVIPAVQRVPVSMRRAALIVFDGVAWLLAFAAVVTLRYENLSATQWNWAVRYALIAMALQWILGIAMNIYRGRSRVGSFSEAVSIAALVFMIGVGLGVTFEGLATEFPRGIAILVPIVALTLMGMARGLLRFVMESIQVADDAASQRALVYGAGDAGHQVAQLIVTARRPPYRILGYLDDDPDIRNLRIRNYRVLGTGADLVRVAREQNAEVVILAISHSAPRLVSRVSEECAREGLELIIIPSVREMIGGRVSLETLRNLNLHDILGRRPINTDLGQIADYIGGSSVLITGAGGSIGSELARQVSQFGPARLVLVDVDETLLHSAQLSIDGDGLLERDTLVLCNVREGEALQELFAQHTPDLVLHAAALKHLPMLERFPREAWRTNVLGTRNVLRAAADAGVARFVNISTDKAADASSVLGRSKRLGERMTAWYANELGQRYISVRFGNVLGSRGSVLFTFQAQIARGGPVTVTHPDVTRYFMTIGEACELVLQAAAIGQPGDVLVLDMGDPVRITDLAEYLINESGRAVEIRYTGLRSGEKLHEVLFSVAEDSVPTEHPLIRKVQVPPLNPDLIPEERRSAEQVIDLLEHGIPNNGN